LRNEQNPTQMQSVSRSIKDVTSLDKNTGVYFLRTNVRTFGEQTTWDYYNLIREIECTNRQLKTDLNLRPIYHQTDARSDAHLFFGLLSYWIVNTIRFQLKQSGDNAYWTEIVRRMSTQKLVTTEAINALGEKVELRQCSKPTKQVERIYSTLKFKQAPFKKIKICRSQPPPE
ncbi:MAG: transposase, partial [Bacteroidales bacterium]